MDLLDGPGAAQAVCGKRFPPDGLLGRNGLVDEAPGRELLDRREEDQRIRHLAVARSDPDTGRLPDDLVGQWQQADGRLDERRAQAGLEPFADYEARMRAQ